MSYTTMNPKFKTVENTVVTQSDILSQAQLPSISNHYNILKGRYVFNGTVGTYALLDENGSYIRIESGAYIDKVIAYQGTSTTGGVLSGVGATLNVGLTTLTNGVLDSVTVSGDGLLSGSLAASTGGGLNKSDPSATTAYSGAAAPIADVASGSSCHPDILVTTKNYLAVTAAVANVTGALNVLVFVATP